MDVMAWDKESVKSFIDEKLCLMHTLDHGISEAFAKICAKMKRDADAEPNAPRISLSLYMGAWYHQTYLTASMNYADIANDVGGFKNQVKTKLQRIVGSCPDVELDEMIEELRKKVFFKLKVKGKDLNEQVKSSFDFYTEDLNRAEALAGIWDGETLASFLRVATGNKKRTASVSINRDLHASMERVIPALTSYSSCDAHMKAKWASLKTWGIEPSDRKSVV